MIIIEKNGRRIYNYVMAYTLKNVFKLRFYTKIMVNY